MVRCSMFFASSLRARRRRRKRIRFVDTQEEIPPPEPRQSTRSLASQSLTNLFLRKRSPMSPASRLEKNVIANFSFVYRVTDSRKSFFLKLLTPQRNNFSVASENFFFSLAISLIRRETRTFPDSFSHILEHAEKAKREAKSSRVCLHRSACAEKGAQTEEAGNNRTVEKCPELFFSFEVPLYERAEENLISKVSLLGVEDPLLETPSQLSSQISAATGMKSNVALHGAAQLNTQCTLPTQSQPLQTNPVTS